MPGSEDVGRLFSCSLGGSGGTGMEGMPALPDAAVCAQTWALMVGWVLSAHPQAPGLLHGSPSVPICGFCVGPTWQKSHQLCGFCEPLLTAVHVTPHMVKG